MEYRKISELKKLENNPRIISKEDFEKLKISIKKFWVLEARPLILSDRTWELVVIGWNMRLEACKQLWITEVPTELIKGLSEDDEKEIIIRDNVSNWEWNMEELANDWSLDDLKDWGVDYIFTNKGDVNDIKENWEWMPEYIAEDTSFRKIIVHFNNQKEVEDFWKILNIDINGNIKSIWFTERKNERFTTNL